MPTIEQTLSAQIEVLTIGLAGQVPPEVLAEYAQEQGALSASGVPAGVVALGAPMPDGELLDVHGAATSIEQVRGGRPIVAVFYRGAWCPYCNLTLGVYEQQLLQALSERHVGLVAISPQTPDGSLATQQTNALTYDVLTDPGNQLSAALGIQTTPSDGTLRAQAEVGIDVAGANADGTGALPMPTAIVIDADGIVRWIDVHPDYSTRSEPRDILAAVDALDY